MQMLRKPTRRSALECIVAGLAPVLVVCAAAAPIPAAAECDRASFEAVVDEAGSALRDINGQNTPNFQTKLRTLKEKRGWSHDQFLTNAAPYVQDDETTRFDERTRELLDVITSLGAGDATATRPDCAMLDKLRSTMQEMVATIEAKWAHMFAKIDKALAE